MRKIGIAVIALLALTGCWETSDGVRVGTILKFSQKGMICKSMEGTMLLGGAQTAAANLTWEFSVDRYRKRGEDYDGIVKSLQAALEAGHPVKVWYKQEMVTGPCRSSSDYFIQRVEPLER